MIAVLAVERVMAQMRTIEIDFDIHKLIEAERRSFGEVPNTVLRRLLGLPAPNENSLAAASSEERSNGIGWTGKGVKLPAGTQLRMEYRGQEHQGLIEDASWIVEGKRYRSPSAAAGGCARTKSGKPPSLDGWKYWFVKRPGDEEWTALSALRDSR